MAQDNSGPEAAGVNSRRIGRGKSHGPAVSTRVLELVRGGSIPSARFFKRPSANGPRNRYREISSRASRSRAQPNAPRQLTRRELPASPLNPEEREAWSGGATHGPQRQWTRAYAPLVDAIRGGHARVRPRTRACPSHDVVR